MVRIGLAFFVFSSICSLFSAWTDRIQQFLLFTQTYSIEIVWSFFSPLFIFLIAATAWETSVEREIEMVNKQLVTED